MPNRKYRWDTTIFLAWLNQEADAPLGDIDLFLADFNRDDVSLVVPVNVYSEVVRAKHSDEQVSAFDDFLKRKNVVKANTTFPISEKAEQIRSRGIARRSPQSQLKIKATDAQIVATAIIYEVDALHTLDDKLLGLDGDPIVEGLKICGPTGLGGQPSLLP